MNWVLGERMWFRLYFLLWFILPWFRFQLKICHAYFPFVNIYSNVLCIFCNNFFNSNNIINICNITIFRYLYYEQLLLVNCSIRGVNINGNSCYNLILNRTNCKRCNHLVLMATNIIERSLYQWINLEEENIEAIYRKVLLLRLLWLCYICL